MPLTPILGLINHAAARRYAVGYFESWNLESLQGVLDAAEQTHSPVIIGFNGEFLSRPVKPEETGLFHNGVALHDTPAYYAFINIALWEDVKAFQEQIDRPYRQRGLSKLPFEYAKCQGIVLQPCQWRLGTASLPAQDQLGTAARDLGLLWSSHPDGKVR